MKKRFLTLLSIMLVISMGMRAQSNPGDIAFIAFNGDVGDNFAFVSLVPITTGTSIWFTDNEWNGTAFSDLNEGEFQWTATSDMPAGSVVIVSSTTGNSPVVNVGTITGAGVDLGASNETLFALLTQPSTTAMPTPYFLAGISSDLAGSGTGLTNTGLTEGTDFINFADDNDGYKYTGARTGETDFFDYLPLIMNVANWQIETSDGTLILPISDEAFTTGTDSQAPVATFTPANAATNVPVSTNITIAFDEAVRNIDNTEITDGVVLNALLTLKTTDAMGADVPFTATIDATKQLITIDPTSDLLNDQAYYVALAPVEDAADNATVASYILFTTIAVTTPVLTLTAPVGGPTVAFDAGETVTITWTSENMTSDSIQIDAQIYNGTTWEWNPIMAPTANDGTEDFTIPADAFYGNQYRIRITGTVNTTATDESGNFTVIEIANDIAELRAKFTATNYTATNVYKLIGEAVVSYYKTGSKENIYIEDNTAAIVVFDNLDTVNTVYNIGDGITGIYGNIPALYHGLLEFIPTGDPGTASSTGNTITPEVVTPLQVTTSPNDYQAEKLQLNHVSFVESGVFAASTNYTITDGTNTIAFRPISAMYDQAIPTGLINLTAICGYYDAAQLFSLEMTDFVDAQDNTSIADEAGLTQAAGDPISSLNPAEIEVLRFNIADIANDGLPTNVTSFIVKAGVDNTADWTTDISYGFFKDELGNNIAATSADVLSDRVVVYLQTDGLIIPEGTGKTIVLSIIPSSPEIADGLVFQAQVGGPEHGFTADIFGSQFAAEFAVVDGNARTVEVLATDLSFVAQPTNVAQFSVMTPAVTVIATDANDNVDVDFAGEVTLTANGATFEVSATTVVAAIAGLATFDNLAFSTFGGDITLYANANSFTQIESTSFIISEYVGVSNINTDAVQVYPNPSQDLVYVAGANNSNVVVRDITGKQMINATITSDNYQLDLSAFAQGMYFVQIENTVYKLIVK